MERLAGVLGKDPAEAAEYLADRLPQATDAATSGRSATRSARRDMLDHDVLFILFDRIPDEITLQEPGEGIHFGLN
ncbi:hypothetical protein ACFXPY_17550 [Streptomyces sp. NPDC059153]|uniref:hypothetical protein n=1 Tax=Streptomyces sp. NPDC059153 TaxID=3346743 RepID=UPI0036C5E4C7